MSELYGKVLVFTVSHDNDRVCLHTHFAVLTSQNAEEPEFYRYLIAFFSPSAKIVQIRLLRPTLFEMCILNSLLSTGKGSKMQLRFCRVLVSEPICLSPYRNWR
jgi:hypothetical protein